MSIQTNSIYIKLRNIGRKLGINKIIAQIVQSKEYEERFESAIMMYLEKEHVVWDIGANVGVYTKLFSEQVGENGAVYAFEPSPINFEKLILSTQNIDNITVVQAGLGDSEGVVYLEQGQDDVGATSRVSSKNDGVAVKLYPAFQLIEKENYPVPNVVKIDTEGFELEVLKGFEQYLNNDEIQLIGIEVHYGILAERGMEKAPQEIVSILENHKFHVDWVDSSHIVAIKGKNEIH